MNQAPAIRREVKLKWIERLFHDLTDAEKELTLAALGGLVLDEYCGTVEHLWARYRSGEVGCYALEDVAGEIAAVTFYEIVELHDLTLCFESLCTVATQGVTSRKLTEEDMTVMEALARSITNDDGRKISSMAMRTQRVGLAKLVTEKHGWYASEITLRKLLQPLAS